MEIRVYDSILKIDKTTWSRVEPAGFPFLSYAFLSALEESGSLGRRTGWQPVLITAWMDATLQGAFVCFEKSNSYGEYIFDFAWANAAESIGQSYYPKLVAAVPFTPATGPKLLLAQTLAAAGAEAVEDGLLSAARQLMESAAASSVHALFIPETEQAVFLKNGFFTRESFQYHWLNDGYRDFSDFLSKLRSKRRREILRERAQVEKAGLQIHQLTGADLGAREAAAMAGFYRDTTQKMGGYDYLTPLFFEKVFAMMPEKILLVLAEKDGMPVAGALNYFDGDTLFGRHWGCLEDYRALHFEVCYYQGIEFAIAHRLRLFEAGAQGEHKFQRGFLPRRTYSAHTLRDPRLAHAVADFCEREKVEIAELFAAYGEHTPFARSPDPG